MVTNKEPAGDLEMDNWAQQALYQHITNCAQKRLKHFNIFMTWKCKTIQNCKWLMCTDLPDNKYYELSYSGDNGELYIDTYEKVRKVTVNMDKLMDEGELIYYGDVEIH